MTTDLSDALERAIPGPTTAPPLPSADARLAMGRHRVRRRRQLAGGALATVVAVAAVLVPTALATAPEDRQPPQVADGGAFEVSSTALVQLDVAADVPVLLDRGVTVLDVVEDPFARSEVFAWAGTVRHRGTTYWALTHRTDDGSSSTHTRPIPGRTIEQWVRDHEEVATSQLRPWVDLGADGSLTARRGVSIVEQQSPAREARAAPGRASAIAMLEVAGARLCVMVRDTEAGTEEVALPESEHKGCRDLPRWERAGGSTS